MYLSPFQKFDEATNQTSFSSIYLTQRVAATWPLLPMQHETDHGFDHWERVHTNARQLAELEGYEGDKYVFEAVELFALLHDSQRVNEHTDDKHGLRAAEVMMRFLKNDLLHYYSMNAIFAAMRACALHTDINPHVVHGRHGVKNHFPLHKENIDDHIMMICLDADRLDRTRFEGEDVKTKYLFTESAAELVVNGEHWNASEA